MIFDDEIIEEKYDPRKLPSMIPSYHHDQKPANSLKANEINKSQQIQKGSSVQIKFKINNSIGLDYKVSEQTHVTNITENEEQHPFNQLTLYQQRIPFSYKRSNSLENFDSKLVEVLQSAQEKHAQKIRSIKVNQNLLQSIHLAQSQTLDYCMNCIHNHTDQNNQSDKNTQHKEVDQQVSKSKKVVFNNTEVLFDKLRLCYDSQVNQGPLVPFQKSQIQNIPAAANSNLFQCLCHCHNSNQLVSTFRHSSSCKSHSGFKRHNQKFHSSIIDSSQFQQATSNVQYKDSSNSNIQSINEPVIKNNSSFNIQYFRNKSKRAVSMIEMIDNPEIRKKWVITKVIQMNFDVQLTHTLIQSIDYFNLSREQILDQMIDKLILFKKQRNQQQLEGSLIQPQITKNDFIKYQQSMKLNKSSFRNEIQNQSNFNLQKQQMVANSNTHNLELSYSLPRYNDPNYTKGNAGVQSVYYQKHFSQSPPCNESIQISQAVGKNMINYHSNNSAIFNSQQENVRQSVSPQRRRNNYIKNKMNKNSFVKSNVSQIKLSYSHIQSDAFERKQNIKKKSQILQQKFFKETKVGICSVCFEEQVLIQISSRCNHFFCSYCITNYFEEKIAKCDVLEINCLNFQCPNKYTETEIKEVVETSTFSQYQKFKKLILIRQDQTLRWCIQLDCNGVLKGSTCNPKMQCPICGTQQCYICSGLWHEGIRCDQAINEEYEKEQQELRKNCPKCLKEVKKSKKSVNKSTCKACGHRFCWLCNRKVTPFHFSTWNFFGCPGMININQIPSWYQKMKYKIKAFCEYLGQMTLLLILLILYPILMVLGSFFLPLLVFFNKNGGTIKYRGIKKFFVVTGLVLFGIILYPVWYIISIVPGLCWFTSKVLHYLQSQRDNQKQESDEDLDDEFEIFSQQVSKGNNDSGLTKPV
ncbi:Ibr domain protein (macronuclear) [Tetrahymena thermophila SB210]|uniref:RBR-type E3 ubiquitin transferase n=1 Tax=Tetrahymena thermophila (strain SB210) TaxID=312017 RepID=I7M4G3_TETTS|nr:Ibr domain protein [Tetrahymena thermophila SB210]EAS06765.2 Ibr domain protein [Tetrahymena thermophila SB210]|eukprot:XP_001027007.2 Ibr domain protein [Tetrahymena thermophila SB210]